MRGNFPKRDNAAVWALRQAGAVILGKTTTAELGGAHPPATTNPFDPARTAGGSSSGSAAAVAARMLPAAIGTQVGGSIIRPAAFCGNVALKPTQGGINRGERQATSMSTHGVHAGCIEDMWQVAIEIAERAGGDRGCLGLAGPRHAPGALKPGRSSCWRRRVGRTWNNRANPPSTNCSVDSRRRECGCCGVKPRARRQARARRSPMPMPSAPPSRAGRTAGTTAISSTRTRRGQRPHQGRARQGRSHDRRRLSRCPHRSGAAQLATRASRHWRMRRSRSPARDRPRCGPATSRQPLAPRPTGDPVFNYPSSMLFAPAVTMPIMAVQGCRSACSSWDSPVPTRTSPRWRGGCRAAFLLSSTEKMALDTSRRPHATLACGYVPFSVISS